MTIQLEKPGNVGEFESGQGKWKRQRKCVLYYEMYILVKEKTADSVYVCCTGALKAMDVAGCCQLSKDRVLVENRKPGALWHIYKSQDSDKIRDLLKKVISVCWWFLMV